MPVHDTAGAARMIAESGSREDAAIASVEAGVNLGLAVLAERIQTEKENFTKFAAIGIEQVDLGRADKTSLVMAVLDNPGSPRSSPSPSAASTSTSWSPGPAEARRSSTSSTWI